MKEALLATRWLELSLATRVARRGRWHAWNVVEHGRASRPSGPRGHKETGVEVAFVDYGP